MINAFSWSREKDELDSLKDKIGRQEASANADLSNLSFGQALENFFTGNYTYRREKALLEAGNAFSAGQAQIARDYDTEMSNTAYQRKVADMTAAGLNPYADLGSGAQVVASPSPSAYSAHTNADSSGFGTMALLLARAVGGAFALAKGSMDNANKVELAKLRNESAYTLAAAKKYNVSQQYYDKNGQLRGTIRRTYR